MPPLPPSATRRLDVEEVLGAAGFTPFHRRAVAITGIAWTFVAMEILLIGFTLPLFGSLWNLSATWLGWIGASALAGSLVGSLLLGRVADQLGRRQIFQASILWYSLFTALTALAWGPASLFALRFLAGIGLGGMLVVDPSLLAEYLPPQRRGRFLVLLDFFWPIGLLIAIGLSWVFLDRLDGAWRWLFVAAALPAFLAYVARRTLPESPYWLARHGRLAEAAGVLGGITGQPVHGNSLAVAEEPSSSPRELFRAPLRATSAVIVLVWIALNVSYYGLFIWLPGVLGSEGKVTLNAYVLLTLVALALGYHLYGGFVARQYRLDDATPTPAVTRNEIETYTEQVCVCPASCRRESFSSARGGRTRATARPQQRQSRPPSRVRRGRAGGAVRNGTQRSGADPRPRRPSERSG